MIQCKRRPVTPPPQPAPFRERHSVKYGEFRPLRVAYSLPTIDRATCSKVQLSSRHRAGATASRVWQGAAHPDRIVERSVVASRDEDLRRHETGHLPQRLAARPKRRKARPGPGG